MEDKREGQVTAAVRELHSLLMAPEKGREPLPYFWKYGEQSRVYVCMYVCVCL